MNVISKILILLFLIGSKVIIADSWAVKQDMTTARYYLCAGVANNKIYAIGGDGYTTNEEYDPTTDSWAPKTDMPTTRWWGFASGVVADKIYAIGGATGGSYLNTNEEYDPITNSWVPKADMSTPRARLAIGVVADKIYAIGGHNSSGVLATNEMYDPTTDSWTSKAPMPTPRYFLAIGVVNNKIYAIGGYNSGAGGYLSIVEEYDPTTDSWTPVAKAPMPTARGEHAIGVLNNKIYAIGGYVDGATLDVNEEYDPVADSWTTMTPMPTARWGLAIGAISGTSKIYAIGGGDFMSLDANEEYSPEDIGISEIVFPTENPSCSEVIVNPSVFKNEICLKFSESSNKPLKITFYNSYGGFITEETFSYTPVTLTIRNEKIRKLGSGVYFLTIISGKKRLGEVKLIKP